MEFDLNDSIEILQSTPSTIKSLVSGLPEKWTIQNEGPDTWSPFDIVGHLIHGEETDWIPRIEIILKQGNNLTFTPFDRFAQFEISIGKTIAQLLAEFEIKRINNLGILKAKNLTVSDLELPGIHPELGDVKLKHVIAAWVVHDFSHISQISKVMAKQYKERIGPWAAYMSIVNR